MAYQPPYGYGGGNYPPYGSSGGQNNREAMLRALAQPDNPNYQYPSGSQLHNVGTQEGLGSKITGIGAGLGASTVAPAVAKSLGAGGLNAAWSQPGGLMAGAPQVGMGFGTSLGVGLGTEIGGALLKPKGQAATESPYPDLTDQYTRRKEGSGEGVLGGAVKWGGRGAQIGNVVPGIGTAIGAGVGALGGGIANAFTRNAKSAYSDFRTQDAVEAIKQMYQTRGGRLPTEAEVEQILIGQGMDPQSARTHTGVVGEKGLYSVLHSLDQNFAKERQAMVDQALGGGPTGSAAGGTGSEPVATPQVEPNAARLGGMPALGSGSRGGTYPTGQSPNMPGTAPPGAPPSGIPQNQAPPQAPTGPAESGAPPASEAPPPAPSLPANADTDGYASPAYVAAAPSGAPPPGWDAKKWSDPAHQTPKYVVGRIMSQYAPTTENMPKVLAEIQKAYPGTTLVGKDSINIPGVGTTDILRAADVGGKGWQWLGSSGKGTGGGAAGGTGGGGTGAGYDASGDVSGKSTIADIIAQLSAMSGGAPGGGGVMSARDALLKQFQAG